MAGDAKARDRLAELCTRNIVKSRHQRRLVDIAKALGSGLSQG